MEVRKPVQVTFVGSRPFPLDMLRHDACFPITQDSITAIEHSRDDKTPQPGGYEVTLEFCHRDPAFARWESFGWFGKRYVL